MESINGRVEDSDEGGMEDDEEEFRVGEEFFLLLVFWTFCTGPTTQKMGHPMVTERIKIDKIGR
jgi:hypothetical protein